MAKLTLASLSNITGNEQSAISTINNNSDLVETAIENTLSRDGTSPNSMGADLDMNSNDILNVNSIDVETIEATTVDADNFTVDGISLNILLLDWEGPWVISTSYLVGDIVSNVGSAFICTVAHVSSDLNQPGQGANWEDVWDLIVQGGQGSVEGPASSTDNAITRWDGTLGTALQDSGVIIDDSDNISGVGTLASGTHTVTGDIVVSGTVDGRDVAADGTKLDTIETGAEVNDSASEILTKLLTVDGPGSNLDADTLDGLSSAAFQPIDADLTAIAALTTTPFGRDALTDSNEAAFKARVNLEANTDFYAPGGTDVALADGGTGTSLVDPGADRLLFWDDSAGSMDFLVPAAGLEVSTTNIRVLESFIIACSDEQTNITTGTAKITFRMPYAFTLTAVRASVNTAPTGSTIIIDINENGSTILSTKLSIDASEETSTTAASQAVISDAGLADDAEITIDFDQVGSSTPGKGVKVVLLGYRP